jgi:holo-[acyl-carrier protein] synthase
VSIIGIGIDAIEIDRVRMACSRTPGLLARLYTDAERAHCMSAGGALRFERLAARFAAKEAAAKALGTGIRGFGWRDIEVANDGLGKPSIRLHGGAAVHAGSLGLARTHLSLSTSTGLALAHVVLEGAA